MAWAGAEDTPVRTRIGDHIGPMRLGTPSSPDLLLDESSTSSIHTTADHTGAVSDETFARDIAGEGRDHTSVADGDQKGDRKATATDLAEADAILNDPEVDPKSKEFKRAKEILETKRVSTGGWQRQEDGSYVDKQGRTAKYDYNAGTVTFGLGQRSTTKQQGGTVVLGLGTGEEGFRDQLFNDDGSVTLGLGNPSRGVQIRRPVPVSAPQRDAALRRIAELRAKRTREGLSPAEQAELNDTVAFVRRIERAVDNLDSRHVTFGLGNGAQFSGGRPIAPDTFTQTRRTLGAGVTGVEPTSPQAEAARIAALQRDIARIRAELAGISGTRFGGRR